MRALEYIKSKHNGEIPYKYGANECAKLMEAYAEAENKDLKDCYERGWKDGREELEAQNKTMTEVLAFADDELVKLQAQNKELLKGFVDWFNKTDNTQAILNERIDEYCKLLEK